ncbi:MAG: ATP-grasp domain-containing protein [Verrucomicrobiota bacterium]
MPSSLSAPVIDTKGKLPQFWATDVIFFANLLELFFGNEQKTNELEEIVGEVDSYGGRLVPILNLLFQGEQNLLVLERHSAGALNDYFAGELGLSLPETIIMSPEEYRLAGEAILEGNQQLIQDRLSKVAPHGGTRLDGYVTDDILLGIAKALNKETVASQDGCWRGNNKLLLHRFLEAQNLPTPPTGLASNPSEVASCLQSLFEQGFEEAVLKSQIGASGIGILRIKDIGSFNGSRTKEIPSHLFYEGEIMVQGWLQPDGGAVKAIHSPSVQMFLDEEQVWLFDVTEQILSHESVHEGNVSPPPYLSSIEGSRDELFRQASMAGKWLHAQGYRGTASTDFLFVERGDSSTPEVYVCEINARVTGATYPSLLARHFTPDGHWLMQNLRLKEAMDGDELLSVLRDAGLLYQKGRAEGILPINFNFGSDDRIHKGQFLCLAPTHELCWNLLEKAERMLPVDWHADRD